MHSNYFFAPMEILFQVSNLKFEEFQILYLKYFLLIFFLSMSAATVPIKHRHACTTKEETRAIYNMYRGQPSHFHALIWEKCKLLKKMQSEVGMGVCDP